MSNIGLDSSLGINTIIIMIVFFVIAVSRRDGMRARGEKTTHVASITIEG